MIRNRPDPSSMPHNICDSLRCADDVLAFLRRRFG